LNYLRKAQIAVGLLLSLAKPGLKKNVETMKNKSAPTKQPQRKNIKHLKIRSPIPCLRDGNPRFNQCLIKPIIDYTSIKDIDSLSL
jgi:hypothetical protein